MSSPLRQLTFIICFLSVISSKDAEAHFGAIIPTQDIVQQSTQGKISLEVSFLHPMEQQYMLMERPVKVAVKQGDNVQLLNDSLQQVKQSDGLSWKMEYQIKRPGDHIFFVEPQPYWEPAEDVFIIHYTKVCVNGFGLEQGWDQPVGLKTEIIPLTRPYGLWKGNLFTGRVLSDGKPVPHAEIEVEYLNRPVEGKPQLTPPADPFITQVVKADKNGVFSYSMPKAGWWGFAALTEADSTIKYEGLDKAVELGAVIWVHTREMNQGAE